MITTILTNAERWAEVETTEDGRFVQAFLGVDDHRFAVTQLATDVLQHLVTS